MTLAPLFGKARENWIKELKSKNVDLLQIRATGHKLAAHDLRRSRITKLRKKIVSFFLV